MYEFVKTRKGWRAFWGVDPLANQPEADGADEAGDGQGAEATEAPSVLPFRQQEGGEGRPAA